MWMDHNGMTYAVRYSWQRHGLHTIIELHYAIHHPERRSVSANIIEPITIAGWLTEAEVITVLNNKALL